MTSQQCNATEFCPYNCHEYMNTAMILDTSVEANKILNRVAKKCPEVGSTCCG